MLTFHRRHTILNQLVSQKGDRKMSDDQQYHPGLIGISFKKEANMTEKDMRDFAAGLGIEVAVTFCSEQFGMRLSVPPATEGEFLGKCADDPRVQAAARVPIRFTA